MQTPYQSIKPLFLRGGTIKIINMAESI